MAADSGAVRRCSSSIAASGHHLQTHTCRILVVHVAVAQMLTGGWLTDGWLTGGWLMEARRMTCRCSVPYIPYLHYVRCTGRDGTAWMNVCAWSESKATTLCAHPFQTLFPLPPSFSSFGGLLSYLHHVHSLRLTAAMFRAQANPMDESVGRWID